jgi:predicted nucleic acid-binding protein
LILSSEFQATLRRLKPERHLAQLKPRSRAELQFLGASSFKGVKLLYDTTVYVDILQQRFPRAADVILCAADAWHSTVTESELAALCGLLDPTHPDTRRAIEQTIAVIDRRPAHRTIAPDREDWRESGILTGLLSRLQGYGTADRRRVLNDALIFATARKHGLTVLTRNINDFDLLQQLQPSGQVLFYSI